MRKAILAFVVAAMVTSGGTAIANNLSDDGPDMIGKSASVLFTDLGPPTRQITSPNGATIEVYDRHSGYGTTFCDRTFYVRDGRVVGFIAQDGGDTCGASGANAQ